MKAILVIDMPSSCSTCKANRICKVWLESNSLSPTWKGFDDILDGCPLKPMPQKKEVEVNEIEDIMHTEYSIEDIYTNKYVATIQLATDKLISLGWNACLKELEK